MRLILCLLLLLGLAACSDKDSLPSGVIPRDKMSHILWDMVQADQYSDTYLNQDTLRTRVKNGTIRLYKEVFQLHQVTPEDFKKSMAFYLDHPDITRELFDSAIEIGKRQQTNRYKNQSGPSGGSYGKGSRTPVTPDRGAGVPARKLPFLPNRPLPANHLTDSLRHHSGDSLRHHSGDSMHRHRVNSTHRRPVIKMS